jgi:hypothetical protein
MPVIAPHYFNLRLSDVSGLNERVKDFFGDSKRLQLAIETGSVRLLGSGSK